jgi:CheY-like chemotaxis protein
VGAGSKFVVRIPAVAGAAASVPQATDQPMAAETEHGMRVLIVDDNVDSAESLARLLQMLGYHTRTECDGLSAVQAAESFAPHAVFLDLGLPRLNGFEAAKRIRQQAGKDLLLVAISGWGQESDRRRSKDAGFDHHFVKPVDIDALTGLLQSLSNR